MLKAVTAIKAATIGIMASNRFAIASFCPNVAVSFQSQHHFHLTLLTFINKKT
jgi:hypothetical protein